MPFRKASHRTSLGTGHLPRNEIGPSRPRASLIEHLEERTFLSVYYVANGGNDANLGTSSGAAWATLTKASNTVVAGDTVHVAAGNYVGFYLDSTHSGTATQRISFLADPGATINQPNGRTKDGINLEGASYVTIDGFTLVGTPDPAVTRAGIRLVGSSSTNTALYNKNTILTHNTIKNWGVWGILTGFADDVDIEHNDISGSAQQHGVYTSNSGDRPIIRNNRIYNNAAAGIHMNGDVSLGGDGMISNAIVERNIIYNNGGGSAFGAGGGSAINCDGVRNSLIQDNLLYNNHASGISLYQIDAGGPAIGDTVVNNTILMASNGRSVLNIQNAATGTTIFNNILFDLNTANTRGSIDISSDSLSGTISDYNFVDPRFLIGGSAMNLTTWRTTTGQDSHSTSLTSAQMQALFTNYAANDYTLAAGSAAIDTGVNTFNGKSAPTYDLINTARPQGSKWDVGAYERVVPPTVVSAVSRKTHGSAGTFDLNLSLIGTTVATGATVEPRINGPTQLVFTFSKSVQAADGTLNSSEFSINNASYSSASLNGSALTLNLSSVINGKYVTVVLQGLTDTTGNALAGDSDLTVGALHGDIDGSGRVNLLDFQRVKLNLLQPLTAVTFLSDLDCSGGTDVLDFQIVKGNLLAAVS